MAESPEVLTQKRRNRSSNSSTNSPDTKKPRSEEDHDGGIDESTVVAPSMAEKFQDTLQEILQKLEKLDTIERAVKNLEATLLNLETRTQALESFQAGATKDISDLKESTNFAEEMYKTKLQGINKQYDNINAKLLNLETENQTLNNTIKELETKNLYLRRTPGGRTLSLKTLTNSKMAAIKRTPSRSSVTLWISSWVTWTR